MTTFRIFPKNAFIRVSIGTRVSTRTFTLPEIRIQPPKISVTGLCEVFARHITSEIFQIHIVCYRSHNLFIFKCLKGMEKVLFS